MSIKPDVWIKRMAESEGMIEPFSENQVQNSWNSFGVKNTTNLMASRATPMGVD